MKKFVSINDVFVRFRGAGLMFVAQVGLPVYAASQVSSMTTGTTTNDFATLPFKHLAGEYYYVKQ